jgi:alkyl hydroperoxide reductase subunit AhpC
MSIQSLISSISNVDREIYYLQQQIGSLDNSIHNKQKDAHRILETIDREKNLTRIISLQKDLTRKNEEITRIEKKNQTKKKVWRKNKSENMSFNSN